MTVSRKKSPAARAARAAKPAPRKAEDEDVVTFDLSSRTSKAIAAAVKGLSAPQRERVMEAIGASSDEIGRKVARWVEETMESNANALLLSWTPVMIGDDLWRELGGVWLFLDHLGMAVDHARIAKAVAKAHGAAAAARYRKATRRGRGRKAKPA